MQHLSSPPTRELGTEHRQQCSGSCCEHLRIAITASNDCNGQWEGPFTLHIAAPVVLTALPHLTMLLSWSKAPSRARWRATSTPLGGGQEQGPRVRKGPFYWKDHCLNSGNQSGAPEGLTQYQGEAGDPTVSRQWELEYPRLH